MKKRTSEPWITGVEYGRSLVGFSINLLVEDVEASVQFARTILNAEIIYADPDVAVARFGNHEWMLHADHTYDDNAFVRNMADVMHRGVGIELRIHNTDPDEAEARAYAAGYTILAPPATKGHGLREVYILDPDGYCWVLDAPKEGPESKGNRAN